LRLIATIDGHAVIQKILAPSASRLLLDGLVDGSHPLAQGPDLICDTCSGRIGQGREGCQFSESFRQLFPRIIPPLASAS
jgi:hypothetical protein